MTHTPGPWEAGTNPKYNPDRNPSNFYVVRPKGEFPHGGWIADCGYPYDEEREANAYLIAAAPELLEALEWAERALAPFSKEPAEKSGMALIRAAILKAKGQSQ